MKTKTWEEPECPLCKTKKYLYNVYRDVVTWETPGKFSYVKCNNCGLIFQSPRSPISQVAQYYPTETYWGHGVVNNNLSIESKINAEKLYKLQHQELLRKYPSPASILDVGTGTGIFLSEFKKHNWKTWGTDISKQAALYAAKTFKIKVSVGDLLFLDLPSNHFDVITLINVLEHTYEPLKTLQKCSRLIKKRGTIVLTLPNWSSLGRSIFTRNWFPLQPGKHLYHFTPKTAITLLRGSGFEVYKTVLYDDIQDNYVLFNNIRFLFSPKFKIAPDNTNEDSSIKQVMPNNSTLMVIGKVLAFVVSRVIAIAERVSGRGDVMTIFAVKI